MVPARGCVGGGVSATAVEAQTNAPCPPPCSPQRGFSAAAANEDLHLGAESEEGEFAPAPDFEFLPTEPTYMTKLTFSEAGVQAMLKQPSNDKEKVRSHFNVTSAVRMYD